MSNQKFKNSFQPKNAPSLNLFPHLPWWKCALANLVRFSRMQYSRARKLHNYLNDNFSCIFFFLVIYYTGLNMVFEFRTDSFAEIGHPETPNTEFQWNAPCSLLPFFISTAEYYNINSKTAKHYYSWIRVCVNFSTPNERVEHNQRDLLEIIISYFM